jgi:hypothetical protein
MTREEKDAHKKRNRAFICLLGGPFLILIGFSIGHGLGYGLAAIGALGIVAAVMDIRKTIKLKAAIKQKEREEAEIRAHQLRQARGQA